jgi:hypothetical protein
LCQNWVAYSANIRSASDQERSDGRRGTIAVPTEWLLPIVRVVREARLPRPRERSGLRPAESWVTDGVERGSTPPGNSRGSGHREPVALPAARYPAAAPRSVRMKRSTWGDAFGAPYGIGRPSIPMTSCSQRSPDVHEGGCSRPCHQASDQGRPPARTQGPLAPSGLDSPPAEAFTV